MYFLPADVQLDIFKYLNLNQLLNVKQSNRYFKNFINECESQLTRKKFDRLEILYPYVGFSYYYFISVKTEPEFHDFQLSKQLEEKWKEAIENSIPMFSSVSETNMYIIVVCGSNRAFSSKFPNFPKNIREMKIARYLLEQLFTCFFDIASFREAVFNPLMIELLFDGNKNIPLQIHSRKAYLLNEKKDIVKLVNFTLDHLISNQFSIYSEKAQNENEIFKILTNGANKFSKVCCNYSVLLHDLIVQHIETSKDTSKTVEKIKFVGLRVVSNNFGPAKYQLTNKHNLSVYNKEIYIDYFVRNDVPIYGINIERIN